MLKNSLIFILHQYKKPRVKEKKLIVICVFLFVHILYFIYIYLSKIKHAKKYI